MARIATCGWSYRHWKHVLYEGVPQRLWLECCAQEFDVVELDGSFYHWPPDTRFRSWAERLPDGSVMAVKAPRGLTHARCLAEPQTWISRMVPGLQALGAHRGPLLVQLPPDMERDDERLGQFLDLLPAWTRPVVEVRNGAWVAEPVFDLLVAHGAAWCVTDGIGMPTVERATATLVYVRLHGPVDAPLCTGLYSGLELRAWASRVRGWGADGHEVFVLFDNDAEGNAVRNARSLRAPLEGWAMPPGPGRPDHDGADAVDGHCRVGPRRRGW
ncbi:DUF72 domain-containing protein [Actinomyces sp.]|uniref:DUF72 domain-containing protein n=1 Tax=Actinomyces sp. TaxID=29317 RepID=UPI00289939F0|nr:DUF72 domain-containing protein [Actinomyces sp.]